MLEKEPSFAKISVREMTMAYGSSVVMHDLNFDIFDKDIFVIIGRSGCGKSTLLKHLIGLQKPAKGQVLYDGKAFEASETNHLALTKRFGVMFQSGALWTSLTLEENISMPLEEHTNLSTEEIRDIAHYKLSLVGLAGYEQYYPSEISGGMKKRAGLARAMCLDPEIFFLDEPGSGLDPLSSLHLDGLILELKNSLNSTFIIVTHELESILSIANNSIFLDTETRTQAEIGNPKWLKDHSNHICVKHFLNRESNSQP